MMLSAPLVEQLARERERERARRVRPDYLLQGDLERSHRRPLRALAPKVGRLLVSVGARLGGLPDGMAPASRRGGGSGGGGGGARWAEAGGLSVTPGGAGADGRRPSRR